MHQPDPRSEDTLRAQWTGIQEQGGCYRACAIVRGSLYADSWRGDIESAEQDMLALQSLGVAEWLLVGPVPDDWPAD